MPLHVSNPCAHHQEVKIALHRLWYHYTYRWPYGALVYVLCIYLRRNSNLCHLQHKLIGFYNPDEKCLQRGTDWGFK